MFAFNLIKYYTVLLRQHLKGLTPQNYLKKYKALKLEWHAMFLTPEFVIHHKNVALKVSRAEMRYADLYSRCISNLAEIKVLNPFFTDSFSEVIEDEQ